MEEDATLGRIGGFRLIKRLATGGTSDVLLARAEGPHGFERTVVLKRLLSEHQSDPDFARMFAREAAAYARLSHPAIVRLFDFFTANGQLVMVLEYVDGVSLAKLMTHAAQTGQKLDDRVCFFIASRIFDALSAAHDARNPETGDPTPVIHRDVNPSNVLIPWDGHAKIADFGIAKITGGDEAETSQGLIKGTYGYMAPEQVRGERVTIRTDVYAASLVLWEMLAGRKAFQADKLPEMELLRAMAEPNLPSLDVMRPEIPETIREAVARGLQANPTKRAITAEEMMSILRAHFDAEDARERLERALVPLADGDKGRQKSFPNVVVPEPLSTTTVVAAPVDMMGSSSDWMADTGVTKFVDSMPIPPEARPPPPARPEPPRPMARTQGTAVTVAVAQPVTEPMRRQTPSGLRAVSPPQALGQTLVIPSSMANKPTMAGGFSPMSPPPPPPTVPNPMGSEPATLETKAIDGSALVNWPPEPPMLAPPPMHISAPPARQAPTYPPQGMAPMMSPTYPPQPMGSFRPPPPARPMPPPKRSFGLTIVLAALAGIVVVALAGAGIVFYRLKMAPTPEDRAATVTTTTPSVKSTATAAVSTAPTKPTPTQTAVVVATVTPSATVSATPLPTATQTSLEGLPTPGPNEGVLVMPAYAQGHRVFVDGRVKGDGTAPIVLPCGTHAVQIGSAGKSRDINVPCGALARIE